MENWEICYFWLKWGSCGTENVEKGVVERLRGREKGVFPAAHSCKLFQCKYPLGYNLSSTIHQCYQTWGLGARLGYF